MMCGYVRKTKRIDVYKRQQKFYVGNGLFRFLRKKFFLGNRNGFLYFGFIAGPVSYTHLDVYKRQEPVRPLVLALHIKAAAERPAGSQDPENLPISGLLVRKSVKEIGRAHV